MHCSDIWIIGLQEIDQAYIVVNNMYTKPCTILRVSGNMYVISFGSGAIRVRESQLFHTAEETRKPLVGTIKLTAKVIQKSKELARERLPWDWVLSSTKLKLDSPE